MKSLKFDGLLEIHPDDVEDHKKHFLFKEQDGKTLFYFEYIKLAFNEKCFGFIKNTKPNKKKLALSQQTSA